MLNSTTWTHEVFFPNPALTKQIIS